MNAWKPLTKELQAEYNILVLYIRGTDEWNDPNNIDWNESVYSCQLLDNNMTPSFPKVISAYQVIKEADELVLKSELNNYALKSDITDLNISQYATNESVTTKLKNYATKEEIIPYELVPVDEWELKHNYRDAGHCDPVTITGLSMGDYVKIVVDNYSDEYPSKILQLGNVGDTEFSFEMFPGNSTITCTQTSENVVGFSNDMDDMYIWQIYTTTHMIKVPTSYTKLLDQIKSLEERIQALETKQSE